MEKTMSICAANCLALDRSKFHHAVDHFANVVRKCGLLVERVRGRDLLMCTRPAAGRVWKGTAQRMKLVGLV